jgi:hypothetical protein
MQLYRYWARARASDDPDDRHYRTRCCAGSNESLEDASARARDRARRVAEMLDNDVPPETYPYADRPLREEIVDEIDTGSGELDVAITRNTYGALILNCSRTFFADIDVPPPAPTGLLASFFGRTPAQDPADAAVERVHAFGRRHPDLGIRLYRTAAGFRAMITSREFDPASDETLTLLGELGSDPRYTQLCRVQASFRARLTPKPWRCGLQPPADRYPWASDAAAARFRQWERRYDDRAAGYATCRRIDTLGRPEVHPSIAPVLAVHDDLSCAEGLPLA